MNIHFRYLVVVFSVSILAIMLTGCNPATTPGPGAGSNPAVGRFLAVGTGGVVLYSDDFGETFTSTTSGTTEVLRDVASDGQGNCVAVGYNGTAIYSSDYGISWQAGTGMDPIIINAVMSYGTNKYIAVGEVTGSYYHGIYRSTDGGASWDEYATTIILKGVGKRSSTDFVAVGNDAVGNAALYLTYSGGDSWSSHSTPADIPAGTERMNEVVNTLSGYFVAVGRGKTLYSSSGSSWTKGSDIIGELYGVAWSNPPGRLVSVGSGSGGGVSKGRLYYGMSLGTSWTEIDISSLTTELLFDVDSNGSGRFVAVGESGAVVCSLDTGDIGESGLFWTAGSSGVASTLYGIGFVELP